LCVGSCQIGTGAAENSTKCRGRFFGRKDDAARLSSDPLQTPVSDRMSRLNLCPLARAARNLGFFELRRKAGMQRDNLGLVYQVGCAGWASVAFVPVGAFPIDKNAPANLPDLDSVSSAARSCVLVLVFVDINELLVMIEKKNRD